MSAGTEVPETLMKIRLLAASIYLEIYPGEVMAIMSIHPAADGTGPAPTAMVIRHHRVREGVRIPVSAASGASPHRRPRGVPIQQGQANHPPSAARNATTTFTP
jgi:hypothetical protein